VPKHHGGNEPKKSEIGDKIYGSKHEIYKDFAIAIKFIPDFDVRDKPNYRRLLEKIEEELGGQMRQIKHNVKNSFGSPLGYPPSHAWFLQVPTLDDAGKDIGPGFLLLAHESGLEVFGWDQVVQHAQHGLQVAQHIAQHPQPVETFVELAFANWVARQTFSAAFAKLGRLLAQYWTALMDPEGGWKIVRVAIRTEHKGVMEMPFSKFQVSQVECLLLRWNEIKHLSEANKDCFGGYLRDPQDERAKG
jgi:hypothetical protein